MRQQGSAVADDHSRSDDHVGADVRVGADRRSGVDHGGRVNSRRVFRRLIEDFDGPREG